MPWVKIIAGAVLSVGASALADLDDVVLSSIAVATLAGAVHGVLRMLTFLGDLAARKSTK